MSYTVTSPQPPGLQADETAVTLDSGQIVAVAAVCSVSATSGCNVIAATARQIDATGRAVNDAHGNPVQSAFQHTTCAAEITSTGSIGAVQKCVLMAVLGESTAPLWTDPSCATMLSNASIRTAIASAAASGPINTASLLG